MFGVATSTVAGRFMIALRCGVGCHTSITASHTSRANSSSVAVNVSGLYSKRQSVSGRSSVICLIRRRAHRDVDYAVAILGEHYAAEYGRGGVVYVHDRAFGPDKAVERTSDQIVA